MDKRAYQGLVIATGEKITSNGLNVHFLLVLLALCSGQTRASRGQA